MSKISDLIAKLCPNGVKGKTAFVVGAGAAGEIGYGENGFLAADDCYYIDGGAREEKKHAVIEKLQVLIGRYRGLRG